MRNNTNLVKSVNKVVKVSITTPHHTNPVPFTQLIKIKLTILSPNIIIIK